MISSNGEAAYSAHAEEVKSFEMALSDKDENYCSVEEFCDDHLLYDYSSQQLLA